MSYKMNMNRGARDLMTKIIMIDSLSAIPTHNYSITFIYLTNPSLPLLCLLLPVLVPVLDGHQITPQVNACCATIPSHYSIDDIIVVLVVSVFVSIVHHPIKEDHFFVGVNKDPIADNVDLV
jgi:hypothetical protein